MKFDCPTSDQPSSPGKDAGSGLSDNQDSSPAGRSQWKEIKELIFSADSTPFRRVKQMVEMDPIPKKAGYLRRRKDRKFKPRFISLTKKENLIQRDHTIAVNKVDFGFKPSLEKYSENITKLVKYGVFSTILQKIEEVHVTQEGSPMKSFKRTISKIGTDLSDDGRYLGLSLRNSLHEMKLKVNSIDKPKVVRLSSLRKNRNYQKRMKIKHKNSQKESQNSLIKLYNADKLSEESISIGSESDLSGENFPKIQIFEVDNPLEIKLQDLGSDSYVSKRKTSLNIQAVEDSPFLNRSINEAPSPCPMFQGKKENLDSNFLSVSMLRPPSTMATTHMESITMKKSSEKPLTVNSDFEVPKEVKMVLPGSDQGLTPSGRGPRERQRGKIARTKFLKNLSKYKRRALSKRLRNKRKRNLSKVYSPKPTRREILRIRNFRSL